MTLYIKALPFSFSIATLLLMCTSVESKTLPNYSKESNKIEYPIGEVFRSMYINGWTNHLVLQNPEDFDGLQIDYGFKTDALDPENIEIVNFHGQQAIRLNRKETVKITQYDQLINEEYDSYLFLEPLTYRYIGAIISENDYSTTADVVTKTFNIPEMASIGDNGLLSKGHKVEFMKNEKNKNIISYFVESWHLTAYENDLAKLCNLTRYTYYVNEGTTTLNECYIIDRFGEIIERDDNMSVDIESLKATRYFATPKNNDEH